MRSGKEEANQIFAAAGHVINACSTVSVSDPHTGKIASSVRPRYSNADFTGRILEHDRQSFSIHRGKTSMLQNFFQKTFVAAVLEGAGVRDWRRSTRER